MGYSLSPGGFNADGWEPRSKREQILEYCPELKIILDMRLEREKCPDVPAIDLTQCNGLDATPGAYILGQEPPPEADTFGDSDDLKKHIEELEQKMEKLKTDDPASDRETDASSSAIALGDPQIADFAHVADVNPTDRAGANSTFEDDNIEDE
jgi:hypothetical protein